MVWRLTGQLPTLLVWLYLASIESLELVTVVNVNTAQMKSTKKTDKNINLLRLFLQKKVQVKVQPTKKTK